MDLVCAGPPKDASGQVGPCHLPRRDEPRPAQPGAWCPVPDCPSSNPTPCRLTSRPTLTGRPGGMGWVATSPGARPAGASTLRGAQSPPAVLPHQTRTRNGLPDLGSSRQIMGQTIYCFCGWTLWRRLWSWQSALRYVVDGGGWAKAPEQDVDPGSAWRETRTGWWSEPWVGPTNVSNC
jgi:hypothetical protein